MRVTSKQRRSQLVLLLLYRLVLGLRRTREWELKI